MANYNFELINDDNNIIVDMLGNEENFTVTFEVVNNTSSFDVFSVKLLDLINYTSSNGITKRGIVSGIRYNKNSTTFTLGFSNPSFTQQTTSSII